MKWWGRLILSNYWQAAVCHRDMHTNTHSHQTSHCDSSANNATDHLEPLKQFGIIMTGENTYVFGMRVQTFKCGVYSFICTFSAFVIYRLILTLSEECCFKVQKGLSVLFQSNKLSQPLLNQSGWLSVHWSKACHTHSWEQLPALWPQEKWMYIISILNLFRY